MDLKSLLFVTEEGYNSLDFCHNRLSESLFPGSLVLPPHGVSEERLFTSTGLPTNRHLD